jgi:hypothetical protein
MIFYCKRNKESPTKHQKKWKFFKFSNKKLFKNTLIYSAIGIAFLSLKKEFYKEIYKKSTRFFLKDLNKMSKDKNKEILSNIVIDNGLDKEFYEYIKANQIKVLDGQNLNELMLKVAYVNFPFIQEKIGNLLESDAEKIKSSDGFQRYLDNIYIKYHKENEDVSYGDFLIKNEKDLLKQYIYLEYAHKNNYIIFQNQEEQYIKFLKYLKNIIYDNACDDISYNKNYNSIGNTKFFTGKSSLPLKNLFMKKSKESYTANFINNLYFLWEGTNSQEFEKYFSNTIKKKKNEILKSSEYIQYEENIIAAKKDKDKIFKSYCQEQYRYILFADWMEKYMNEYEVIYEYEQNPYKNLFLEKKIKAINTICNNNELKFNSLKLKEFKGLTEKPKAVDFLSLKKEYIDIIKNFRQIKKPEYAHSEAMYSFLEFLKRKITINEIYPAYLEINKDILNYSSDIMKKNVEQKFEGLYDYELAYYETANFVGLETSPYRLKEKENISLRSHYMTIMDMKKKQKKINTEKSLQKYLKLLSNKKKNGSAKDVETIKTFLHYFINKEIYGFDKIKNLFYEYAEVFKWNLEQTPEGIKANELLDVAKKNFLNFLSSDIYTENLITNYDDPEVMIKYMQNVNKRINEILSK